MSLSKKYAPALLLLVIAIIAVGGYLFGQMAVKTDETSSQGTISELDDKANSETLQEEGFPSAVLDNLSYMGTSPSNGPLVKKTPAILDIENQKIIFAKKENDVDAGQRVMLYDKDDNLVLDEIRVAFVSEGDGSNVLNAPLNLSAPLDKENLKEEAYIITKETASVMRLPLSAVQKDEEGKEYIWRAVANDELVGFIVNPHPVDTLSSGDTYFEVDHTISPTDLVITNPDKDLQENALIKRILITQPDNTRSSVFYDAWMDEAIKKRLAVTQLAIDEAKACYARAEAVRAESAAQQEAAINQMVADGSLTGHTSQPITEDSENVDPLAGQGGGCGTGGGGCGTPAVTTTSGAPTASGGCASCGGTEQAPATKDENTSSGETATSSCGSCGGAAIEPAPVEGAMRLPNNAITTEKEIIRTYIDPYILLNIERPKEQPVYESIPQ